ncbi:MAG: type II toxin-antitoxin system prevent-host-death family antitoxin [Candidatus Eremiobacteraeota bacterium]|nr:type II toxin-antitoxin system prevent-host-death family antitoxin [Candidatus Eremiobacteraeota bacterium]MBV9056107.1 type II toxin-antitoxin system prevent-host-death family antitoxin [Candidatus Eremiobacteraeota bacterium]MBV9699288.1 type II toxin-antitoxin system prevent-host-death family antitoxin [Candidatus Eremiobacteraeota bacterium]
MVGVRDAKARLSYLLREAQQGREYIVTDRGKGIAKIVPVTNVQRSLADRLRRLEEIGVLEPGPKRVSPVSPPLPLKRGLARRLLDRDREG